MKQFTHSVARLAPVAAMVMLVTGGLWAATPTPDTEIIPFGSDWRYLHLSVDDPDDDFNDITLDPFNALNVFDYDDVWFTESYDEGDLAFDDGDGGVVTIPWQGPSPAPLGYGTINGFANGFGTQLVPEPDSGERYSLYLRKEFNVSASAAQAPHAVEWLDDDGMTVYIDGEQISRQNCCQDIGNVALPPGANPTFLDRSLATGDEDNFVSQSLDVFTENEAPGFTLSPGNHTIAISVHNTSVTSSDIGLEFRLFKAGNARPWGGDFSGDWADPTNWQLGVPNQTSEFAVFGDVFAAAHTVWNDTTVRLDGVQFDDTSSYNVAGTGLVSLSGNNRDASLNVLQGDHQFQVRVELGRNTDADIADGTSITFNNRLDLNNRTLTKMGGGDLMVRNKADEGSTGTIEVQEGLLGGGGLVMGSVMASGSGGIGPSATAAANAEMLIVKANATIQNGGSVNINLFGAGDNDAVSGGGSGNLNFQSGSILNVALQGGYTPADGAEFTLFRDWGNIVDSGATINLPTGIGWDDGDLFSMGILRVGGVGDPCDLDTDGDCDVDDINMLTADIASGNKPSEDLQTWLADAATKNGFSEPYKLGDANLDGTVNAQDLNALGQNWQTASNLWGNGDFTADGQVNAQDLNQIGQNWQATISAPIAATVPEPSSLALLAIAGFGLMLRKRR